MGMLSLFLPPGTATPTSEHITPCSANLAAAVFTLTRGLALRREGSRYF